MVESPPTAGFVRSTELPAVSTVRLPDTVLSELRSTLVPDESLLTSTAPAGAGLGAARGGVGGAVGPFCWGGVWWGGAPGAAVRAAARSTLPVVGSLLM